MSREYCIGLHGPEKGSVLFYQRAQMKYPGVSGKNAVSVIAILCICLLMVTMAGFLFSHSIDNFTNNLRIYLGLGSIAENQGEVFTPDPTLFTVPAIPGYSPNKK
jgi:hypothetical protein